MTLNCSGNLIDLSVPKVMGILNVTPDSFYDGGTIHSTSRLLTYAEKHLAEGATFLDVGGYSSRPGAADISEEEEKSRVLPAIEALIKEFPQSLISIDTFRSSVALAAIKSGACMVNDISGGSLDQAMWEVIAAVQVPYIMMHMKGTPQTMTQHSQYENIAKEVLYYFSEKLAKGRSYGINDLLVDPGFGFAKNRTQNFELLQHLELFQNLEAPLLVGLSRKSMIYKTLEIGVEEALNGTTALNTIALLKGAHILRVHDVKEAMQCIRLLDNFKK